MIPIWRPCSWTERALSFFGSNFIARLLRGVFVAVAVVEEAFLAFARLILEVVAHERLHYGYEGAGHHEKVAVEHADKLKKRVVARHDLPRLDAGDVHLAAGRDGFPVPSGSSRASRALPLRASRISPGSAFCRSGLTPFVASFFISDTI